MGSRKVFAAVCLVLCASPAAQAQDSIFRSLTPRVATRANVPTENEIRAKRSALSSRLREAEMELKRIQEASPAEANAAPVSQEVDLLKQRDAVLAQQQTAEAKQNQLTQRIADLQTELEQIRNSGISKSAPYSYIEFDQLQNELESSKAREESIEAAVAASANALTAARQAQETRDAALRLAKDTLDNNRDTAKQAELEAAVRAAELEAQLANDQLSLQRLRHENEKLNKQVLELTTQLLDEKLKIYTGKVQFTDADLQEILVQIERQEQEVRQSSLLGDSKLQYTQRDWDNASRKLNEDPDDAVLKEEVAARRIERQLAQQQLDVLNLRLGRLTKSREVWARRAKVFNEQATNAELADWAQQAREQIANLNRERRVQIFGSDDIRKEITALESRLQALNEQTAGLRPWIEMQLDSWREFLLTNDRNLASIDSTLQLHEDLLAEIEGDMQHWTLGERVSIYWKYIVDAWNTELVSIDDRPITIGKVVIGILFLFIGFFAARIISRLLGNRLLTRFGLNEGAVAALKSLIFYSLVVVFTLLALRFANVPLTIFTLLGGALAIGVGFGSQAVINNFISGLIILAERPIQVGDLVKLDDLIGNVTHIGARSTRIRTGDNLDIIVPNSKFLETNVLNFTLGDDKFRTHIKVGLAYGSPTRDATRLLVKAANEHGQVMSNPKPFVWFRDFGDNALAFELHVWIKVRTLGERLRIESDLRYRVDQLFREGGIVIAFPQRDVHLDVAQPLDIRMLSSSGQASNDSGPFSDAA